MTAPTTTLTGIQPTGELHLGNYAGAIRPLAELAAQPERETYVFVADLHALNGRPDPDRLRDRPRENAAPRAGAGGGAGVLRAPPPPPAQRPARPGPAARPHTEDRRRAARLRRSSVC